MDLFSIFDKIWDFIMEIFNRCYIPHPLVKVDPRTCPCPCHRDEYDPEALCKYCGAPCMPKDWESES